MLTIGSQELHSGEDTGKTISEMMSNLAVSTPVLRLMRDLLGRELKVIERETGLEDKEITERISSAKGFEDYLQALSFVPFGEFCVHEMIYATPEGGSLQLSELIRLPNSYISYDIAEKAAFEGWYYEDDASGKFPIKPEDFTKSVYGRTIDQPMGYGMFRYGVLAAYEDLTALEAQIRALHQKYGAVIPIFSYDPVEAETPEGLERLQARVDGIKEMGAGNNSVIGVPLGGFNKTLKDGFQFISLSDLSIDMHITLINRLEDKLETFLMGARFSKTDSGSQAKDTVQESQKDKMVVHLTHNMTKELQKLLTLDGELFGYDPLLYEYVMIEQLTEREALEKLSREIAVAKQQTDSELDLARAKTALVEAIAILKGQGLEDEQIATMLETEIEIVTPIAPKVEEVAAPVAATPSE